MPTTRQRRERAPTASRDRSASPETACCASRGPAPSPPARPTTRPAAIGARPCRGDQPSDLRRRWRRAPRGRRSRACAGRRTARPRPRRRGRRDRARSARAPPSPGSARASRREVGLPHLPHRADVVERLIRIEAATARRSGIGQRGRIARGAQRRAPSCAPAAAQAARRDTAAAADRRRHCGCRRRRRRPCATVLARRRRWRSRAPSGDRPGQNRRAIAWLTIATAARLAPSASVNARPSTTRHAQRFEQTRRDDIVDGPAAAVAVRCRLPFDLEPAIRVPAAAGKRQPAGRAGSDHARQLARPRHGLIDPARSPRRAASHRAA